MLKGVLNQHIQDSVIKLQIWDDQFLKMTRSVIKPEHFTAPETEMIVRVIYDYFEIYKESPKDHFRNILQTRLDEKGVPDSEFYLYKNYLDRLDEEVYANKGYVLNTISDFVRRATLRDASFKFAELIEGDKFKEAESVMYKALKSGIVSSNLGINLGDSLTARLYRYEPKEYLLTFDIPKLDSAVGGMERKTLVLIVAPLKGLKSWFMVYLGARAYATGLRVVHFTHEMSEIKVLERYDQALFELAHDDGKEKTWRSVVGDEIIQNHPVTYRKLNDLPYISERLRNIRRLGGKLFIKEYATGTCTVSEIERYIELLEVSANITPDVIISDYGDIMAAEGNHSDERSRVNSIYTRLRALAVDRNMLVITASQGVRSTVGSGMVGAQHTAEDIRKPALADLTLTVARTEAQIDTGQGTLRVAATREGQPTHFNFGCNLDFGQFYSYEVPLPPEVEDGD
jgi:replicative DNA helicase